MQQRQDLILSQCPFPPCRSDGPCTRWRRRRRRWCTIMTKAKGNTAKSKQQCMQYTLSSLLLLSPAVVQYGEEPLSTVESLSILSCMRLQKRRPSLAPKYIGRSLNFQSLSHFFKKSIKMELEDKIGSNVDQRRKGRNVQKCTVDKLG